MNVWGLTKKYLGISLLALPLTLSTTLTGCLTDDPEDEPPAAGDSTKVKEATLGAQGSSTGSFLDADGWNVYKQAEVTAALQAEIDLVFAYSTSQTTAAFYSPKAAADGIGGTAGFDFVKTALGTNARTTEIRTVSTTVFDGIKTKAALDSAWAAASASVVANGRLAATQGSAFIVQSSKSAAVAFKVTELTNTADGTVKIQGKAKF